MEKLVRKFKSHKEADVADREFYLSLTPEQRLETLEALLYSFTVEYTDYIPSFIARLNRAQVDYLLIGGYATACHAIPRFNMDADFFIHNTPKNIENVVKCATEITPDITQEDMTINLTTTGRFQFGKSPNLVDIHTNISDVSFSEARQNRKTLNFMKIPTVFIGRDALVQNKRALGRHMDRWDLEYF
jgi:hypothetical protein